MRILITHNIYQHSGGEDSVVEAEATLLRQAGHQVSFYWRNNDEIKTMSQVALAAGTLWSRRTARDVDALISRVRPDVIHSHNTFPLISPTLYWAAGEAGVPVVQTLHNFRLMCLNALFLREEKVCEDCMGRAPWKGVVRSCFRSSRPASAALAGMLAFHRGLGTYRNKVARYIALNEFCRNKFIVGGLPADRVVVKPNFVDFNYLEPAPRAGLLFVGRLSMEKGIAILAEAIQMLPDANFRVVGDGPKAELLDGIAGVMRLGRQPGDAVRGEMSRALALVVPSICYENFPRTIVEAFASGLPVIASHIGSLANIVRDGETGLLFAPGDAHDLTEKMIWASTHPDEMRRMGAAARQEYERFYTPERNYQMLMDIYRDAIAETKGHGV